jgi:hypothetical protein
MLAFIDYLWPDPPTSFGSSAIGACCDCHDLKQSLKQARICIGRRLDAELAFGSGTASGSVSFTQWTIRNVAR